MVADGLAGVERLLGGPIIAQRKWADERDVASEVAPGFGGNQHRAAFGIVGKCAEHEEEGEEKEEKKDEKGDTFMSHRLSFSRTRESSVKLS